MAIFFNSKFKIQNSKFKIGFYNPFMIELEAKEIREYKENKENSSSKLEEVAEGRRSVLWNSEFKIFSIPSYFMVNKKRYDLYHTVNFLL